MKKFRLALILIILFSSNGCAVKSADSTEVSAAHDITGTWEYTLIAADGNVYDNGTIEFSGAANRGSWTLLNFYNVEYAGTYIVNGNKVLLAGDETWQGAFVDDTHLSGQWKNNEASGEWTAIKK